MMPFFLNDPMELPDDLLVYVQHIKFRGISKHNPLSPTRYAPLIKECFGLRFRRDGDIAYLTVHESIVDPSVSQRRPGLHTETPGTSVLGADGKMVRPKTLNYHHWGMGSVSQSKLDGGIYSTSRSYTRHRRPLTPRPAPPRPRSGVQRAQLDAHLRLRGQA
jgi:hypothetical protein